MRVDRNAGGCLLALAGFLVIVAVLAFATSLTSAASDHFRFALPWHLPGYVYDANRQFERGRCVTRSTVGPLRRVATVAGWLTSDRGMYVNRDATDRNFAEHFVDDGSCLREYTPTGGP